MQFLLRSPFTVLAATVAVTCGVAAPCFANGVVVFRGAAGGPGDVTIVDPLGLQPAFVPPGLAGVRLLEVDFNGRVQLDVLRTDLPQLRRDIPLASRIELPNQFGSLYRFARTEAVGQRHGLFLVDSAGDARIVFEMDGVGAAGAQSPIVSRIAVSPDGAKILLMTRFEVGGNVLELDLASGAVLDRTSALAPLRLVPAGLHFASQWGLFATNQGVWRFDLTVAADAVPVVMPGVTPAWFSGEIALSRNGAWAVTTAGDAEDATHVFVFGLASAAVQVTTGAPSWISPAGYQPEHLHGPYLAVSDDGSHCAWRTEGVASREAWLALVPQSAQSTNHWLTSDANYIDTIDEIGQYMFKIGSDVLIYSAGERDTGPIPKIENIDFYEAQLPVGAGAPALLNVTQSSGVITPPFLQPAELKPSFAYRDATGDGVIFHSERSGGSGDLLWMEPAQAGYVVLVPDVKDVSFLEQSGSHVFVNLLRNNGSLPRELHHFAAPYAPSTAPLLSVSAVTVLDRTATRTDGWFAFVEGTSLKDRLWRFDPSFGSIATLTERKLFYGPAIDWAPNGDLAFSVGSGGAGSIQAVWPTNSPVHRLPIAVGPGFILP